LRDLRAALEQALGPIYRVGREVRPLGDCRLFVAVELAGGSELLVKILPGELSLGVDAAAFERELMLLAGRLGHPGLVRPQGAGRAGSFIYHTRAFVKGTTLRAALGRYGEMPLRRTVEILRSMLAALAHAHAAKLAHGDLRPENVLLTEGGAVVADAGVVDAVRSALEGGGGVTGSRGGPGVACATLCAPAYLAPERRDAGAPAGPRDDMYAVGVILHEMLTGRPPAPESESLEEVRAVPAWLADLVRVCLSPDPGERWEDAGAALEKLSPPLKQ